MSPPGSGVTEAGPELPHAGPAARSIAVRLAITCWLVYGLHFATNMVRENYLALAIGERLSFRVDAYANLHDDIFEHPGFGWHIGSNPGASMVGAIPYALSRPLIDRVVAAVQRSRAGTVAPPEYRAPTDKDRRFFEEAWRRGLDVRFGLASFVMQTLGMAVVSALGVVAMFLLLRSLLPPGTALALALLYAFGTPVFLRTGFLNHNLMLGHAGLAGFAILWDPRPGRSAPLDRRFLLGGLAGGVGVLMDYSGFLLLAGLWLYGMTVAGRATGRGRRARLSAAYALGAAGPLLLLWFYQWRAFGHPFLPPQHWMPPVEWSDRGYQGVGAPQPGLAAALAFDYRYGLFVSCPLFLLAVAAPFVPRNKSFLPRRELMACLALSLAFLVFFSAVNYTRWQFNTGVRYLAPTFPFLFLAAAVVLHRLPRGLARPVVAASVALAWCMAMARDVSGGKVDLADPDTGLGVLDPVLRVVTGGFQLPALTTISRMEPWASDLGGHVSALPLMSLTAVIIFLIWRRPGARSAGAVPRPPVDE